eukprot:GCRY01001836.1.p1 GENE.GCRY01001836.1~~GCRY01001836.1.p1  ORF type:complete len:192 (-),score=11.84 GCRY01001836.1:273-848(-)
MAEIKATKDMCAYCFQVLESIFDKAAKVTPNFENFVCPLFVTLNIDKGDGSEHLRGCIGTFSHQPIHTGLAQYVEHSAFHDHRFSPLKKRELDNLIVCVSLLTNFETAQSWNDWEVGKHGINISFHSYHATFLPEVAAEYEWDHLTTLQHLLQKAGYYGAVNDEVLSQVSVERYQSSKCKLSYQDFVAKKY